MLNEQKEIHGRYLAAYQTATTPMTWGWLNSHWYMVNLGMVTTNNPSMDIISIPVIHALSTDYPTIIHWYHVISILDIHKNSVSSIITRLTQHPLPHFFFGIFIVDNHHPLRGPQGAPRDSQASMVCTVEKRRPQESRKSTSAASSPAPNITSTWSWAKWGEESAKNRDKDNYVIFGCPTMEDTRIHGKLNR